MTNSEKYFIIYFTIVIINLVKQFFFRRRDTYLLPERA